MLRTLRKLLDMGLPITGVVIVVCAVLFLRDLRFQLAVVIFGLILIESGIWKISNKIFPNDRQHHYFRSEIDQFIELCRQLNTSAVNLKTETSHENQQQFDDIRHHLEETLERIIQYAGKTEEDISKSREYVHVNS